MTIQNQNDKDQNEEDSGTSGEEGQGGVGGKIHFRYKDAASLEPRDDMLPPTEIQRLLRLHGEIHKARVDKQKAIRKERKALKEGKLRILTTAQQGYGGVRYSSQYKTHPISHKAQFSGIDKQITGIPTEFDAETNLEMREQLENRFVHRNIPKFNPKPRPRG